MKDETEKKKLTFQELGRAGGLRAKEKMGVDGYKDLGRTGGSETVRRYGRDYMVNLGSKGGKAAQENRARRLAEESGEPTVGELPTRKDDGRENVRFA